MGACSGILYLHTLRRSVCNFFSPAFVRAHLFLWPALSLQWVSQQKWLHNLSGLTHGDMLCYVCWQRVYRPFLSSCDLMDWSALPDARLPLLPSLCSSFLPWALESLIPCAQIPLLGLPNYYSVALIGETPDYYLSSFTNRSSSSLDGLLPLRRMTSEEGVYPSSSSTLPPCTTPNNNNNHSEYANKDRNIFSSPLWLKSFPRNFPSLPLGNSSTAEQLSWRPSPNNNKQWWWCGI